MILLVQMGGNHHLVPVTPQPLGQLHTDPMGNFRSSFTRGKGLIPMVGNSAILFAEPLFDCHHFHPGCCRVAVDTGYKTLHNFLLLNCLLSFAAVDRISDNIIQPLTFPICHILFFIIGRVGGLVRVLHIHNHLAKPTLYPPDRCDCHRLLPHGFRLHHRFGDFFNRSFKLAVCRIIPLNIDDIEGVGFLGDLI